MTTSMFFIASGVFFFGFVLGFIGGALFFRRHGQRIENDVNQLSKVGHSVVDTTKNL